MNKITLCAFMSMSVLISGCVSTTDNSADILESTNVIVEKMDKEITTKVEQESIRKSVVFEEESTKQTSHYTKVSVPKNPVDINITNKVPFGFILESVAADWGWSVQYAQDVDTSIPIALRINNIDVIDAMEDIAGLAGYTVIIDKKLRRCTVASTATWTFLLPANVTDTLAWNYSVGGSPSASSEESSGGLEGISTDSTITGSTTTDGETVINFIESSINAGTGEAAIISNIPSLGVMLVTGNMAQLKRAEKIITRMVDEVSTRVEINVAIVEISLEDTFQLGVRWEDVLRGNFASSSLGELVGTNATASASYVTDDNISFVLEALKKRTDYSIVSRPNLLIDNHTPADLSDSRSIPYISEIEQSTTDGVTTTTATTASAIDGLKLSVLPHVLAGGNLVQLKLVPFFGVIPEYNEINFGLGGEVLSLNLPTQSNKQAFISVTVESGQTLVLAGNRYSNTRKSNSGLPYVSTPLTDTTSDTTDVTELAIIINTRIILPPPINVILDKSL